MRAIPRITPNWKLIPPYHHSGLSSTSSLLRKSYRHTPSIRPNTHTRQLHKMTSPTASQILASQITMLKAYNACDISDALLKLKVPNAGFLPDLKLQTSSTSNTSPSPSLDLVTIAPASTVTFVSKTVNEERGASNIPKGKHWVDLSVPETIVVISQPEGQKCAVVGGIMGERMKYLDVKGVVVDGRVRDLEELGETGLPIWSKSTSIVGAGAEAKAYYLQTPLNIDGTKVNPGDLVVSDPMNGVVVIPQENVEDVLELLPRSFEADEMVKGGVKGGMSVAEAFETFR